MPECSKTHLQQSTISKFSGGGPPALRGGKGKGGEEREPTSKGRGGPGGNGERGEGEGKGNICRTNVKLLPAPLLSYESDRQKHDVLKLSFRSSVRSSLIRLVNTTA